MAAGMLVAAEEVFAEAGLSKAHVDEIARRARVSVGSLYNYYGDRDGLLAAVLTTRTAELQDDLAEVIHATTGRPVRTVLLELVRAYFRFVVRRRTFIRILFEGELAQLKESYPTSSVLPPQCLHGLKQHFADLLARGIREGSLPATHADVDLWLFLGLLRGVVMRDLRGQQACRESDADRVIDVFFDGASV
jgi:AcrR family transcriptional regulator